MASLFNNLGFVETVDKSTTYKSWKDLVETVTQIYSKETEGDHCFINTIDPTIPISDSHVDHHYTGLLVQQIVKDCGGRWRAAYWRDYTLRNNTDCLNFTNFVKKFELIKAIHRGLAEYKWENQEWNSDYLLWSGREQLIRIE